MFRPFSNHLFPHEPPDLWLFVRPNLDEYYERKIFIIKWLLQSKFLVNTYNDWLWVSICQRWWHIRRSDFYTLAMSLEEKTFFCVHLFIDQLFENNVPILHWNGAAPSSASFPPTIRSDDISGGKTKRIESCKTILFLQDVSIAWNWKTHLYDRRYWNREWRATHSTEQTIEISLFPFSNFVLQKTFNTAASNTKTNVTSIVQLHYL